MKGNDFIAGDRCVAVVPSDTIDNVVFNEPIWVTGVTYPAGKLVSFFGVNWLSLIENTSVSPVEGATWTRTGATAPSVLPSIIYCDGTGGTIKVLTFGGDIISTNIQTLTTLMQGKLHVKRVFATGTTALALFAIAN